MVLLSPIEHSMISVYAVAVLLAAADGRYAAATDVWGI